MNGSPRYWCPPTGRIALDGGGFLADPSDPFGFDQTLSTYDEVDHHRCLVLLGEPGIGKTTELERAVARAGDRAHRVDLGAVADPEGLRRAVIEAPTVTAWREGDGELFMFLDAFDEAREERGVLVRVLIEELGELPHERLRLRIACRTADWPATLTDRLGLFFVEDAPRVYELQPLRRADVVAAAADADVDGEEFMAAVVDRGVGPLARVPLTLRFLLDSYARDGQLPTRRAELYREGCRELCREQNTSRVETDRAGTMPAEQRLALAERIAAGAVLAGRAAVRVRGAGSDSTVVELREIDGASERTSADVVAVATEVDVDQLRLREALATGLFTSRGDDLLGFAHHSYGEFLAARFLNRHRFDVRRALNLLAQERAGRQRIVPQLAGVAAWLADLDPDVLDWLIANEPEIALTADVAGFSDERKAALVDSLLGRAAERRLTDYGYTALGRLGHPDLADQLEAWLRRDSAGPARRLAIEIAGAAEVTELFPLLVELVLDEDEVMRVRVDAGWALSRGASSELCLALKPLALEPQEADTDDDLKGTALLCLWPASLSVEELLPALTPPKRDHYLGAYGIFLSDDLLAHLTDSDLVGMLAWARDLGTVGQHRRFGALIDDVLAVAWRRFEVDEVAAAFTEIVVALLPREHRLGAGSYRSEELDTLLREDTQTRRALAERLVPALASGAFEPYHLITAAPLVRAADLHWLLERAISATDDDSKCAWARLADWCCGRPTTFADAEALLAASAADEVIRAAMPGIYGDVAIDSPEAAAGRDRQASWGEMAKQRAERERQHAERDAASPARVEAALQLVEGGDVDAYLTLDAELLYKPGANAIERMSGDVRAFPNWQAADDQFRERLVAAAERYLSEGPRDGQALSVVSHAAYRALRLVRAQRGRSDVDAARLGGLVPAMLAYSHGDDDDRAAGAELLADTAEQVPDAFIAAVVALVEREAAQHGTVFSLGRLAPVPVGPVDEALCELVRAARLPPHALVAVLEAVLERGAPCATPLALEFVDSRGEGANVLAVAAAALLLVRTSEREPLERVVAAILADSVFGRAVIEWLADRGPTRRRIPTLPEDLTADLFLFAAREFGWDDDGWTGHDVGSWRDSLLARLRDAGTEEAQAQLERLRVELPELEWLARVVEQGEARTVAATWLPPPPDEIIALAVERSRRYVATGAQLLEAVIDALELVQRDLDSELSGAAELWHRREDGLRPVSEPEGSSWLQRRLTDKLSGERGIIFHREVQVTHPASPAPGQRTDLHVNAVVPHRDAAAETLTTIVEVKGCWNRDVETALETQLIDDYLLGTGNRYGIYLLIWFEGEPCGGRDRDATMQALAERARELEDQHAVYLRVVSLKVRRP